MSFRVLKRRVRMRYRASAIDHARLADAERCDGLGEAVLVKGRRGWFLKVSLILPDAPGYSPETPVGVDRGISWMVVARVPGNRPLLIRGQAIKHDRDCYVRLRGRLQRKGTRAAKRVLQRLSGRERRFFVAVANDAASAIVKYASRFERPVLVLEDLRGIQRSALVKKPRLTSPRWRFLVSSWGYGILLQSIVAAAEAKGMPVSFVDAAWTSRTCPQCGDARKENRHGPVFRCKHCDYRNHADVVGATNIARRWLHEHARQPGGRVNGPDECGSAGQELQSTAAEPTLKPPTLLEGVDTPPPT